MSFKHYTLFAFASPCILQEEELFDASAQHAYASFRNKAAASRGLEVEDMQAVAQGRVWSGRAAIQVRACINCSGGCVGYWLSEPRVERAGGHPGACINCAGGCVGQDRPGPLVERVGGHPGVL